MIRTALEADVPLLAEVERSAGELFAGVAMKSTVDPMHTVPPDVLERARLEGNLWVAVDEADRPTGFVLVTVYDGTTFVAELSVARPAQGRGLGAAMMRTAIDAAKDRSHRAVTLTTFRDVAWNRPFYEKLGFRVLAPSELSPELAAVLGDEASRGLAPDERCAMELRL
jgi:GNAT superfamily N-acetyltransferase